MNGISVRILPPFTGLLPGVTEGGDSSTCDPKTYGAIGRTDDPHVAAPQPWLGEGGALALLRRGPRTIAELSRVLKGVRGLTRLRRADWRG